MKHFNSIVLVSMLLAGGFSSCVKEKNFPIEPAITFKSYNTFGGDDSADCIIKFKDGDGDIGVQDGDTATDLEMKYLYYDTTDLQFHPMDSSLADTTFDTLFYRYRVPYITPDGQYKALDGEIKVKLRAPPIYGLGHDKVKFEITLKDRAGHKSNMVTTSEINVP